MRTPFVSYEVWLRSGRSSLAKRTQCAPGDPQGAEGESPQSEGIVNHTDPLVMLPRQRFA